MRRAPRLVAVVLAGAAACTMAPRYERPKSPVGAAFAGGAGSWLAAADRGWRDIFGDPRLQKLIEVALENNRDLRIAALNVELTEAQYQIERSELLPSVDALAAGNLTGNRDGLTTMPGGGLGVTQYRVGLTARYELDLFGRVRSLKDAALEEYLATAEAQRAAHLSLVAAVVSQYLRERAYDEQRVLAERTVEAVTQSLEMTRRLRKSGQRSDLDAHTAAAQFHAARAEVLRLTRLRAQAEHALAVLVGAGLPKKLPDAMPLETQAIVADLPAGLPSDLLQRRPDILAAEHLLKSANASIGAARAAFFPNISLTGFAGLASSALSGLVGGGLVWGFSPQVTVPLFAGGSNKATLDVAHVRKRIEIARYERAIQIAFREVADALVARTALEEQLAEQLARAEAEEKRFELSQNRYRSGVESYLVVLAAQQDLYQTQQQLIEIRYARLTNLADLYAALGGGWR